MDDLISRKQALEYISAWQQANAGAETQTEYAVIESCYRMMQNLPTAYDVEAVVRELEAKSTFYAHEAEGDNDMGYEYLTIRKYGISDGLQIAIEVVRGGRNEEHFN